MGDNTHGSFGVFQGMAKEDISHSPERHALIIGINSYPFVDAQPLKGCVNDAERMAILASDTFGFKARLLVDSEATRDGILAALERLLDEVRPGEQVLVHYSGHGSRILRPNGGAAETIVPHDSGRGVNPNRDITDQEFRSWMNALWNVTPYLTLVFDSCHAGGVTRDLEATARGLEADQRFESLRDKTAFSQLEAEAHRALRPHEGLPVSERFTLLAACRPGERACEMSDPSTGKRYGAFTLLLTEELARLRGVSTFREVFDRVARRVSSRFHEQNPQLEGAWDRQIFGSQKLAKRRFLSVASRQENDAELDGGAIHDVVPGSEWNVYSPGTQALNDAMPSRIKIESVTGTKAKARLLTESDEHSIVQGGIAVEDCRPLGEHRLTVHVPAHAQELVSRIRASPLLRWTHGPGDVFVEYALEGWSVTDLSGAQLLPILNEEYQVFEGLGRIARRRALAELRHPHPEHLLKDVLDIEIYRRRPGGAWQEARSTQGELSFFEGDFLGIRTQHDFDKPLYVAIIDLGLAGSVEVLYPERGAVDLLPPGDELAIGFGEYDGLEFFLPEGISGAGERETLLFLVGVAPFNLDVLVSSERSLPPEGRSPLDVILRRLLQSAGDHAGRQVRRILASAADAWTVTSRSFWLRRAP